MDLLNASVHGEASSHGHFVGGIASEKDPAFDIAFRASRSRTPWSGSDDFYLQFLNSDRFSDDFSAAVRSAI
jgi:hypothetical protein